ncbi:hypothetical protein C4D60_Mb11t15170 [Musa balbisiana]|uniref:Uncharacterized protein n=1 Tax=Musa balbisiana TaxID=52838 RepID=A0A4S8J477_MUSBA|nr:hypothetical protein C4D60_Mb11t15170 [Musa balbisiana]
MAFSRPLSCCWEVFGYGIQRNIQLCGDPQNNVANDDCGEKKPTIIGAQRKPQRTEKPRTMSHTMWRRRKAWPETRPVPALPTWQGPRLVTRTPAHAASGQPHQYVTPFAPHTGSGRKQLMRQEGAPPSDMAPQRSATASMPSDRAAGMRRRRRRRRRADSTAESRGELAIARRRERTRVPEP